MLIGLIVAEPSAMARLGSRPGVLRGMPIDTAVFSTFCGPSGSESVRSAYAVFTESWVALVRLIAEP